VALTSGEVYTKELIGAGEALWPAVVGEVRRLAKAAEARSFRSCLESPEVVNAFTAAGFAFGSRRHFPVTSSPDCRPIRHLRLIAL